MALDILANYVEASVTSGGTTAPAAGTSEGWTVTTTENWPVLGTGQQLRIMDKADLTATSGYEIMLLTANANGTGVSWTVTRGVEGTTPWAHASNFTAVPATTAGGLGNAPQPDLAQATLVATNMLYETIDRSICATAGGATIISGDLYLTRIALPEGLSVGHILFNSAGSAAVTPTHWWFGLFDNNRNALALTADQTSTAWSSTTQKSLAIATTAAGSASSFTTTYAGWHYLGIMVAAGTTPTQICAGLGTSAVETSAPVMCGLSNTSQTTPPSFPFQATSLTGSAFVLYGGVAA